MSIRDSVRTGLSFGFTSGIITTLGLMVGLHSGTHSQLAVLGGILTIAIADAFSDALGIHISEESKCRHTPQEIWASTLATFIAKIFFASIFIVPVLLFELTFAVTVSVAFGLLLLGAFSWHSALQQKASPWKAVAEHVGIALLVITATHFVGDWIATTFV